MSARKEFEQWSRSTCFQEPPDYATEYAFEAYKAGLEAAAKVCDERFLAEHPNKDDVSAVDITADCSCAECCSQAIRKLKDGVEK